MLGVNTHKIVQTLMRIIGTSDEESDKVDYYLKLLGKRADEIKYLDEVRPFCSSRIDGNGWCTCDTIGGD